MIVIQMNLGKGGERLNSATWLRPLGGSQIIFSCHNVGKLSVLKPFRNVFNHLAYDERQNELSSIKDLRFLSRNEFVCVFT